VLVVAAWLWGGGETADGTAPGRNGLIAVHVFRTGEPQAWMLRPDGRDVTRLPVYGEAAFSPDGRRLAIARGRTLSVTDLSGATQTLIHRGPRDAHYEAPAWAATGDEILFSQAFDDGVFAAPVSGGGRRRVAPSGYEVDVSLTGRVALQLGETFSDTRPRVITVDGEGGDRRQLGRGVSPS
jgi:hypothetical protein